MSIWLSRLDWTVVSHYASRIFLVFFVLLFGWQLGAMLSFSLSPMATLNFPSLLHNTTSNYSPPRTISIDLLGRQMVEPLAARQQKDVGESRLNLEVLGIVALPDDKGLVIVKVSGQTLLASVGEKIQDRVYLEAVYSDYVVIDHNGVLEKLRMSESNELLESDAFGLIIQDETKLGSLKKELKKSPMKIMQYVRFQLINAGKHNASMKLWPKKETQLFEELGLEKGDILKMVNGHSIAQLTQKPRLWIKALNEPVLEMEVERQGQVEFLVIELK
jgi:general secretion pathway protein C